VLQYSIAGDANVSLSWIMSGAFFHLFLQFPSFPTIVFLQSLSQGLK